MRIEPLVTAGEDSQIGSASVDLTLSNEWWFFKREYLGKQVDLSKVGFEKAMERTVAQSVVLPPGGMCLGKTIEKSRFRRTLLENWKAARDTQEWDYLFT